MPRFCNALIVSVCIVLEWLSPLLAIWVAMNSAMSGRSIVADLGVYLATWPAVYLLWILAVRSFGWPDRNVTKRIDSENNCRQEVEVLTVLD